MKKEEMLKLVEQHKKKIIIVVATLLSVYILSKEITYRLIYETAKEQTYKITIGTDGEKARPTYDCLNNMIKKSLKQMSLSQRISLIYDFIADEVSLMDVAKDSSMLDAMGCFALSIDWGF